MIYIRQVEDKFLNNKYKFFNIFSKMEEYEYNGIKLIEIKNLKDSTIKKLLKYINSNCISRVVLSKDLFENSKFCEILKNENIKIHDGRWIFKELTLKIVKFVSESKNEKMEYQEVSILSNKIDRIVANNIKLIAKKVRILNIVSNNPSKFRKIEKELYEENGIILNVSNNYKKSLVKSNIILNYDFEEDELNKYTLPKKACIINFEKENKIYSKSFEGINAFFFEMNMPLKYFENSLILNQFSVPILYESFIYKNTIPDNIIKEIDEDDLKITFLEGKNGKIRKSEYINLAKKIAN